MTIEQPKEPVDVVFTCSGKATGKLLNEHDVKMVAQMQKTIPLATART